jgi:hypothetical protein
MRLYALNGNGERADMVGALRFYEIGQAEIGLAFGFFILLAKEFKIDFTFAIFYCNRIGGNAGGRPKTDHAPGRKPLWFSIKHWRH